MGKATRSQFLRELHFIEAVYRDGIKKTADRSQFLRELLFIEAATRL